MALQQKIAVNLSVMIFKEKKDFIATCPALSLSTHGTTLAQAQRNFEEAFKMWFETVIEMGTLRKALHELGWKVDMRNSSVIPAEKDYEKTPMSLVAAKSKNMNIPVKALS